MVKIVHSVMMDTRRQHTSVRTHRVDISLKLHMNYGLWVTMKTQGLL